MVPGSGDSDTSAGSSGILKAINAIKENQDEIQSCYFPGLDGKGTSVPNTDSPESGTGHGVIRVRYARENNS